MEGKVFTYDYPDATKHFWRVNFTQTGLAQHNEIMGLKKAYEQTKASLKKSTNPNKDLVLVGLSRGASSILIFAGLHKPEQVKGIIVESPFDSTRTIAQNMLRKLHLDSVPGMQTLGHWAISAIFWQHSTRGIQGIDSVESIDKDLPILFVCSREDSLIPVESTIALYKKLRENGHKKVHIFIANAGRHGRILHGSDGKKYQRIVHAFYQKYGMHHDKELADLGEKLLLSSQPDM